jgi:hypothetical protein
VNVLITNNVHRHLGEPPQAVAAALRRIEPLQPLRDALAALGLDHLVSVRRTEVPASRPLEIDSFSLTWRLAHHSSARVVWMLSVKALGDQGSLVSATICAGSNSATGRQQLLVAWPLLGRIIETHTTRLLNAAAELAEELAENDLALPPARLLAAA